MGVRCESRVLYGFELTVDPTEFSDEHDMISLFDNTVVIRERGFNMIGGHDGKVIAYIQPSVSRGTIYFGAVGFSAHVPSTFNTDLSAARRELVKREVITNPDSETGPNQWFLVSELS